MNLIQIVSILGAALAVSFGAIGPALGEGRAVAAAMDAIARQPEAANTISRTLVRRPGDDRNDGDLLSGHRAAVAVRQSVRALMRFDWTTLALQTVNVLVLLWLLRRFLFRPVVEIIAERKDAAEKLLAEAAAARDAGQGRVRSRRRA